MNGEVWTKQLWDEEAVLKNGTLTSDAIQLDRKAENWRFSLGLYFTSAGAATVTAQVLSSIDGTNFSSTDAVEIVANAAKGQHRVIEFDPLYGKAIKIQLDEDDVADITALTAWACIS